jgi:hypothetical protein
VLQFEGRFDRIRVSIDDDREDLKAFKRPAGLLTSEERARGTPIGQMLGRLGYTEPTIHGFEKDKALDFLRENFGLETIVVSFENPNRIRTVKAEDPPYISTDPTADAIMDIERGILRSCRWAVVDLQNIEERFGPLLLGRPKIEGVRQGPLPETNMDELEQLQIKLADMNKGSAFFRTLIGVKEQQFRTMFPMARTDAFQLSEQVTTALSDITAAIDRTHEKYSARLGETLGYMKRWRPWVDRSEGNSHKMN